MTKISWWKTNFGEAEIEHVVQSIRHKNVSQGKVTAEFENKLADFLKVEHVVAASSGSSALLMSLMAIGIKPGDEVILPNRTWIATAHAVHLLGAKVVLVDVEKKRLAIDVHQIESKITTNTRAIVPVHMNGRSCDMDKINQIASKHNLYVIEDAAQAFASKDKYDNYLGTQSDIGCFSLSVAKLIATGQGGFAVTNNSDLADRLRSVRTHGVENIQDPKVWPMPGFNFRFTDIQASIGIEQLRRVPNRIDHLRKLYIKYRKELKHSSFQIIPVDIESGEIPLYNEYLVDDRDNWVTKLLADGIETRPFYPSINAASYLKQRRYEAYPNSIRFENNGIYLPSGPDQPLDNVRLSIESIMKNLQL